MSHKIILRQIVLPITISIIISAVIIRTWPNNGTLGHFTTNHIGSLLGLDGEAAYDAALLEAWLEISLCLMALFYGFRKLMVKENKA